MNTSNHGRTGSDFVGGLQDAIQKNPVSAVLIGVGVLWMFAGGKNMTAAAALFPAAAKGAASTLSAGLQRTGALASDATGSVRSMGASALESVSDAISDTADAAGKMFATENKREHMPQRSKKSSSADYRETPFNGLAGSMQQNLTETFERQPLLLGAIGLAVGCAMAAALPATRLENEWVGDVAERTKTQAAEFASEATAKVVDTAERAYDAIKEGAAEEGLTPDALRAGAETVTAKVRSVTDAAGSRSRS